MPWTLLAQQFCHELGFGGLRALAFVPPAPVGVFFYRLMGSCAALPLALAFCEAPAPTPLPVSEGKS